MFLKRNFLLSLLVLCASVDSYCGKNDNEVDEIMKYCAIGFGVFFFLIVGTHCLLGSRSIIYHSNGYNSFRATETKTEEKSYNLLNNDSINLTIKNNHIRSITVEGNDGRSVGVTITRTYAPEDKDCFKIEEVVDGNNFTFTSILPRHKNVCGKIDFYVTIPKNSTINVSAENSKIDIKSVEKVTAQTSNSKIKVDDANVVDLKTSNASINCFNVSQKITAQTSDAKIKVLFKQNAQPTECNLSTSNGRIQVKLPSSFASPVFAAAIEGKINGYKGITYDPKSNFKFKTSYGKITIKKFEY